MTVDAVLLEEGRTPGERWGVVGKVSGTGVFEMLASSAGEGSLCLQFIDPYGDVMFNHLQAVKLIEELETFRAASYPPEQDAVIEAAIELAARCQNDRRLSFWFVGE